MWINIILRVLCGGILLFESILDVRNKKVHAYGAAIIALCGGMSLLLRENFSVYSLLLSVSIGTFLFILSVLTEEKIGRGDAIYMIALGILLSFEEMMIMSMFAFLAAAVISIVLLIMKKADKSTRLAFFPFIMLGYMAVSIISFYYETGAAL